MKKVVIALTMLVILSVLVACGKTTTQTDTGGTAPLSDSMQLLVGTFKLEDTDLAVTSDQAKQLLPLWQTLQELSASNTSATEEINAVVDQIKSTMTSKQMDKITSLKLTQQDVRSLMGQNGFANGPSTTTTPMALNGLPSSGNSRSGDQGGFQAGGPGGAGGPPAGDFPAGGGGFQGGGDPNMSGGASGTPQAVRPSMGNQIPAPLMNALIELLQKKIK
jgi:hypothetical protein